MNFFKRVFSSQSRLTSSSGFSLVEILVALTLLGIAGTFVAGKIFDSLHEGQVQAAKIQMQHLAERLKEFRRHCGFYPAGEQGLEALINKPSGRECKRYAPNGYIDGGKVPLDPWDAEYQYESSDGKTFNIYSFGGDNAPGGEDKDKDLYLYEKGGTPSE